MDMVDSEITTSRAIKFCVVFRVIFKECKISHSGLLMHIETYTFTSCSISRWPI